MTTTSNSSKFAATQLAVDDNGFWSTDTDEAVKALPEKDGFWFRQKYSDLKSSIGNWNKVFPYQLIIAKKDGGRYIQILPFTLPIPPESMSISMPFAINTTVTLGGIVEEHNGAPLRTITFSGSTGVVPLKGVTEFKPQQPAGIETLFAGTVSNARATQAAAVSLGGATQGPANLLKSDILADNENAAMSTGWYQFRLLQRFLEAYATIKKSKEGRDYRMVVGIWKDQALYLATPVSFDVQRHAQSPLEYRYSLQFKAWKRIAKLDNAYDIQVSEPVQSDKTWIKSVSEKINAAMDTLINAENTIRSVRTDIDTLVFEPIRSIAAAAKLALNIPITLSDLPVNIIMDARKTVESVWSVQNKYEEMKKAWQGDRFEAVWAEATKSLGISPVEGTEWDVIESANGQTWNQNATNNARKVSPSTSDDNASWVEAGGKPSGAATKLMGSLPMSDFKFTPSTAAKIAKEKARLRSLTASDYQSYKNSIEEFMRDYATAVGATTNTFERTYGRTELSENIAQLRTEPTDEDYEILWALNDIIMGLDKFLIEKSTAIPQPMSALEYIGGLASQSGIAFTQPVSKFGIPFPYGTTLERLAARYLNDPNRWHEIAALNGLRSPYVDEVGFELDFIVNGSGSQIVVASTQNLYVGQPVWIRSSAVSTTKRTITGLQTVGSNLIVRVSGERDMDSYKHSDGAVLRAYLPDTINSQQLIYIPSSLPSQEESFRTDKVPTVDATDELLKIAGIDLLLNSSMDLIITPDGDGRWAVGLNNLIQRLKIGISTPVGSLLQHPDYGIKLDIGMSIADLNPNELLDSIKGFVATDPAFTGVSGASIVQNGPSVQLAMSVGVNGVGANIPIVTTLR